MQKKRIFFRSDGNSEIGLGHVVRSLALADVLKNHFECIFATRFLNDFLIKEISNHCSSIIDLGNNTHFEDFLKVLNGDEIVVLDNYFFSTDYQKAIKEKGCKLVCIDDMHDKHYVADVVINHSLTDLNLFSIENYTQLKLGFNYALLRKAFLEAAKENYRRNQRSQYNSAFICLGGSDYFNLTGKIILDLNEAKNIKSVTAVIGAAYQHKEELGNTIDKSRNIRVNLYSNVSAEQMCQLMLSTDFAILPASSVLIEALSLGVAVISGYYVDNQEEFYNQLANEKRIFGVGNFKNIKTFLPLIQNLNKKFSDLESSKCQFSDIEENYINLFNELESYGRSR